MSEKLILFFLLYSTICFSQNLLLIDRYSGEKSQFIETNKWYDNTKLNASKIDGVIFINYKGKFYKRKIDKAINILWFGITEEKNDLTDVLCKATTLAYKLKTSVFIPQNGYKYELKKSCTIYSSIISDNAIIKGDVNKTKFFSLMTNDIKIVGINFEVINTKRAINAPIAIAINGLSNVEIINNNFKNCRISCFNNSNYSFTNNIKIVNNNFDIDFSNYSFGNVQNDVLYIYDVKGLIISNNVFNVKNSNRIMKISSRSNSGKKPSSDIVIDSNTINSTTWSKKQVIDLYQHTKNVTISNNSFNCYGHNSVIENKTNGEANYTLNLKIIGNHFVTDKTSIRLFGNFGSNQGNESGHQNVIIKNNLFKSNVKSQIAVNIAHYNTVLIESNKFTNSTVKYLRISGIENLDIHNNEFNAVTILLTDEEKVGKHTFSNKFDSVKINNNKFDLDSEFRVDNSSLIKNIIFKRNLSAEKTYIKIEDFLQSKNSNILKIN